ncbi:MAG: hypothetical protein AB1801_05965, partial [Chloroflexota bacterium]
MSQPIIDRAIRLIVIVSLLIGSCPPVAVSAGPGRTPRGQTAGETATPAPTEEPATATPSPTDEPATATPAPTDEPATATPAPSEEPATATVVPTGEPATPTPTETATPSPTLPATATATLTPTVTATVTPTVTPVQVGLTMQADPAFVQPGDLVTVTLTLSNAVQLAAGPLLISATLPVELSYDSPVGPVAPGYNPLLNLLTWSIPPELAGQATLGLGFMARVTPGAAARALNLTAEVSGLALAGPVTAQAGLIISPAAALTPTPAARPTAIQAGPPASIQLAVKAAAAQSWLAVVVRDEEGLAVADGTEVTLSMQGGQPAQERLRTHQGAATARFSRTAGQPLVVTARAGQAQAELGEEAAGEPLDLAGLERGDGRYGPAAGAIRQARNALRAEGNQWRADNAARRVEFGPAGLSFALKPPPAGLASAPDYAAPAETPALSFELTGLRLGQTSLLTQQPQPRAYGNWATYEAAGAGWQLAYEVGDETVEQYFVFEDRLPGEGDLVIEGRFQTRLQPQLLSDEEGIRFVQPGSRQDEPGSLGYGPALVEDARGRRLTARLELHGKQLRLTIPGDWLAGAEFPLVVDPLIGPAELVSTLPGDARRPALAYDGSNYLTVWDWNGDIYGQFIDSNGEPVGELIAISQAAGWQDKAEVVYNPASGEYLAAWVDHRFGSEYRGAYAQRLSPTGTLLGAEIELTPPYRYLGYYGGVKGDIAESGDYLLVWAHHRPSSGYDVFGQRLAAAGDLIGPMIEISGSAANYQYYPDVAYDNQSDRFLAAWADKRGGSEYDLYGQRLEAGGSRATVENELLADTSSQDVHASAVAANDNGQFLVAWGQKAASSDYDVWSRTVAAADGQVGPLTDFNTGSDNDRYPAVTAISTTEYLVVWQEDGWRINAQRVGSDGSLLGTRLIELDANAAAPAATLGGGGQAMAVWEENETAGQRLIFGQRLAPASDASVGDLIFISPYFSAPTHAVVAAGPASPGYRLSWEQAAGGPATDIFVQGVDAQAQPLGEPLNLTGQPAAGQRRPGLAVGAGSSLAAWSDGRNQASSGMDIYGQLLDLGGVISGSQIVIDLADGDQGGPHLAYNSQWDEYLLAWEDDRAAAVGGMDVFYQIVGRDGSLKLNPAGQISIDGEQGNPQAAYNPDTGQYFLAFWDRRPGTLDVDVYGQFIDAGGSLAGSSFEISAASGNQYWPAAAYSPAGQVFLVAWEDLRHGYSNYDIYGQIVSGTAASLVGNEIAISTATGNQRYPALAAHTTTPEFVATWQDRRNDSGGDIY